MDYGLWIAEMKDHNFRYVHRAMDDVTVAIGGHYSFSREVCTPFNDRNVFYLVGYGVWDTTCCGPGGCGYALVQGYILEWKTTTNESGDFISLIEPVRNADEQKKLRTLIVEKETVHQVNFVER
jgi:hypothetical protein